MATILEKAYEEEVVYRLHEYEYANDPGRGCAFDCDERGDVLEPDNIYYLDALEKARSGVLIDKGVRVYRHTVYHRTVIQCEKCEERLALESAWLNTCSCGTDYSGTGQTLAPRSQWGEETGESLSDILRGPDGPDWY